MLNIIKKAIKQHPWVWYNVRNRRYRCTPQPIEEHLISILNDLDELGIARSDFRTIFPDISWEIFCSEVYKVLDENISNVKFIEHEQKDYVNFVLGLNPIYSSLSPWSRISEHKNLKNLASCYFRLSRVDMRYYNIWKHETSKGDAKGSQLWHRDREDEKILKIFICIEDVDDTKGPFTFATGTHKFGNLKGTPRYIKELSGVRRTTDQMMNEIVPMENWIKATGKKGDIIFADTSGYHKGGFVQEGYRLLFTCMYVSPACERNYFRNHS